MISAPFQQLWLSKLMGYTYEIHYKKGQENAAVDALSIMCSARVLFLAISVIQIDILNNIKASYNLDPTLQHILQTCQGQQQNNSMYTMVDECLRRKGKLVISPCQELRTQLL